MNVLHVVQGYYPGLGGTEKLIQGISESLVKQYADSVTVFTTNCYNGEAFLRPDLPRMPVGWEEINGVKVRRFPVHSRFPKAFGPIQSFLYLNGLPYSDHFRTMSHGPWIQGLDAAVRQSDADVVSAASFPLLHMYVSQKAAHATGRPSVLTGALHPDDRWGFNRNMIYQAIRNATAYVALTEFERAFVCRMGADPHRVFVAGGGVDAKPYASITQEQARQKYGLKEGPLVGFIGQVAYHKLELLLFAMPAVWEQVPEAQLLIAGSKTLYHDRLMELMAGWPEEKRNQVTLIYNFAEEEKPYLFSALDVLAYPSSWESFGIAYVEAWAAGKPVIGTNRGAIPWLVEAGRDGLLIRYPDIPMLAEAVVLLLKNPKIARSMGQAGREKTLQRYTWEQIGQRYREIYSRSIDQWRAAGRSRA